MASGAVLGGLVFGLAQWLVLRPASRDRAEWMLGTVAGWTAAFTLGAALSGDLRLDALGGGVVDVSMTGALGLVVMGLVAAVALIWLFPAGRQDRTAYVRWWP